MVDERGESRDTLELLLFPINREFHVRAILNCGI
jgi:hypothetical protein